MGKKREKFPTNNLVGIGPKKQLLSIKSKSKTKVTFFSSPVNYQDTEQEKWGRKEKREKRKVSNKQSCWNWAKKKKTQKRRMCLEDALSLSSSYEKNVELGFLQV